MSINWSSDLTSCQKAILGLVVRQGSERVIMEYFTSEAIFALVPRDSQKNLLNIRIIFYSVASKGVGFSWGYCNNLINPLSACSVAFKGGCIDTAADRGLSYGESATVD